MLVDLVLYPLFWTQTGISISSFYKLPRLVLLAISSSDLEVSALECSSVLCFE